MSEPGEIQREIRQIQRKCPTFIHDVNKILSLIHLALILSWIFKKSARPIALTQAQLLITAT